MMKRVATRYDANMDQECIRLCDALNAMSGVRTFESCCGHGTHPFGIWFVADALDGLRPLLDATTDDVEWTVSVRIASGTGAIIFYLEGPADVFSGDRLAARLPMNRQT
jgi:hypothetical protein